MLKALRIRHLIMLSTLLTPLVLVSGISLRLAIAHQQAPKPQAIFMLGGGLDREKFTAELAADKPDLDIWISSGSPVSQISETFQSADAPLTHLHLDYQATDTVTNFTTIVNQLENAQIKHTYLITSEYHMRRARAIAFFVLGSRGITYTTIATHSKRSSESKWKTARDIGRSIIWLFTGKTGASFEDRWKSRFPSTNIPRSQTFQRKIGS